MHGPARPAEPPVLPSRGSRKHLERLREPRRVSGWWKGGV
nr:MAG TPA: hypothetical protein [Caudoviricetes sp.]